MATKTLLRNGMKIISIIQRDGPIHKFDLMDKASISLSTYQQIKPYLEHRYGHHISYDRRTGMWTKIEVDTIEP